MLNRKTTLLPCTQLTVGSGNWDVSRKPIVKIIIHTIVGTIAGANARFNNSNEKASAHYGIGLDGKLYQWVNEDYTAYGAGKYDVNQESINIEHEDGTNPQTNPEGYNQIRPDILYQTSSALVADICKFYGIPVDRAHILKHSEVSATKCPDALDIDHIVILAKALLPIPPAPIDPAYIKQLEEDRKKFWAERDAALTQLTNETKRYNDLNSVYTAIVALGVKTVDDLQAERKNHDNQIVGFTEELSQVRDRNAQLANEIAKMEKDESTALDNALQAIKERDQLKNDLAAAKKIVGASTSLDFTKFLEHLHTIMTVVQDYFAKQKKPGDFSPGTLAPVISATKDNFWKDFLKATGLGSIVVIAIWGIITIFNH